MQPETEKLVIDALTTVSRWIDLESEAIPLRIIDKVRDAMEALRQDDIDAQAERETDLP